MKLINPEDFRFTEEYWYDNNYFHFGGFVKDEGQITEMRGDFYNDEAYFYLHWSYLHDANFGYDRAVLKEPQSETLIRRTHPWLLIVSGDHPLATKFTRFESYAALCDWMDNPTFERFIFA